MHSAYIKNLAGVKTYMNTLLAKQKVLFPELGNYSPVECRCTEKVHQNVAVSTWLMSLPLRMSASCEAMLGTLIDLKRHFPIPQ
jgi:hypothetical protein